MSAAKARAAAKVTTAAAKRTAVAGKAPTTGVPLSNPDKVLYPAAGFTKTDVRNYYLGIAPVLLPHMEGRPLTLKRYPNGVDGPFFYEKRCPSHKPDWVKTTDVWSERNQENINYCVANDAATLAWLANLACLEIHPLLFKARKPDRPTSMVFDFDPGEPATLLDCLRLGLRMREVLSHFGLECFPKSSGGKGLHLWVPLNTPVTFEQTKQFSRAVAQLFEKQNPGQVTSNMRKDLRHGKIFVDWSQNDEHKTTVCAYSLRARSQPTVSTPLTWTEVEAAVKAEDPARLVFTADQVLARVKKKGDLFEPVLKLKQRLPKFTG
ncbi:MAG TPA: non-homologous end-joining DNA ligase [Tepidisphaeraceae bacterium]|nr:non-homologous end-joining DNA ligase [Tepidisphaeraceae bacterium]